MRLRLTPSGANFFALLTTLASRLVEASQVLPDALDVDPAVRRRAAERLQEVEHEADEATHAIIEQLNRTFVTPFDRDDLYSLASALDDCADAMEKAADLVDLYQIDNLPAGVTDMIDALRRSAELTAEAMPRLKDPSGLEDFWVEINRLENHLDRTYRRILAQIYTQETDPIRLMKIKEVVDTLEDAGDAFERVANHVETIAVKES